MISQRFLTSTVPRAWLFSETYFGSLKCVSLYVAFGSVAQAWSVAALAAGLWVVLLGYFLRLPVPVER